MSSADRFVSNSFMIANAVVDELLAEISGSALKCYLFIVRKTRGWGKSVDAISISQFVAGTGLSNRVVIKACDELAEIGLINQIKEARKTTKYSLTQPDISSCDEKSPYDEKSQAKVTLSDEKSQVAYDEKSHTENNYKKQKDLKDIAPTASAQKPIDKKFEVKKPKRPAIAKNLSDELWQMLNTELEPELHADFIAHRQSKRAQISNTALKTIITEAQKADWSLSQAITELISRDWRGFKAEWVKNEVKHANNQRNAGSVTSDDFEKARRNLGVRTRAEREQLAQQQLRTVS